MKLITLCILLFCRSCSDNDVTFLLFLTKLHDLHKNKPPRNAVAIGEYSKRCNDACKIYGSCFFFLSFMCVVDISETEYYTRVRNTSSICMWRRHLSICDDSFWYIQFRPMVSACRSWNYNRVYGMGFMYAMCGIPRWKSLVGRPRVGGLGAEMSQYHWLSFAIQCSISTGQREILNADMDTAKTLRRTHRFVQCTTHVTTDISWAM